MGWVIGGWGGVSGWVGGWGCLGYGVVPIIPFVFSIRDAPDTGTYFTKISLNKKYLVLFYTLFAFP